MHVGNRIVNRDVPFFVSSLQIRRITHNLKIPRDMNEHPLRQNASHLVLRKCKDTGNVFFVKCVLNDGYSTTQKLLKYRSWLTIRVLATWAWPSGFHFPCTGWLK